MLRKIALILVIAMLGHCLPAAARTLKQDELWFGKVELSEDVLVPAQNTLTIAPGTEILTRGNRIVAFGKVNILGEEEDQVRFLTYSGSSESEIRVYKVKPYNINTKILKEEFDIFKIQYAILWSVLFASMFLMLEAR
jgi:hypothetical protein